MKRSTKYAVLAILAGAPLAVPMMGNAQTGTAEGTGAGSAKSNTRSPNTRAEVAGTGEAAASRTGRAGAGGSDTSAAGATGGTSGSKRKVQKANTPSKSGESAASETGATGSGGAGGASP